MSKKRPAASGYARLTQADEEDSGLYHDSDDDETLNNRPALSKVDTRYAAIQPTPRDGMRTTGSYTPTRRRTRVRRSSSGVDIKAINARLERWADEIASKFKNLTVKGKTSEEEQLEIHHTVFQAPEGVTPITEDKLHDVEPGMGEGDRFTKIQFDDIVENVRVAIEMGTHPKMITQGSSGSYFARNTEGKVVGVFKPKDEEPYASRNPKWTKWIHRNLFPCFFGRACLIPNLSYVSEAAAYVLDAQLRTHIVPYTDIVYLTSKVFYYDFWERRRRTLPAKPGSFQVFLKGYKDANIFLREHPWPDQNGTEFRADIEHKKKRRPLANCIPSGQQSDDEEDRPVQLPSPMEEAPPKKFQWTSTIKQSFREQLEKLVILDYIMRNTDRGLDNWMIKVDWHTEEVSIVVEPPKEQPLVDEDATPPSRPVSVSPQRTDANTSRPYRRHEAMIAESRSATPMSARDSYSPSIMIGAIDNSLSWPWKHPDAWRSFPFGWLFLPVSLIGQPFSQKTRDHFLPLLTSTAWWSETQMALRRVFAQDADFKESMFARQIAVMKGQAWNVVETLKQPDHGPLELTRRTRVCVWDDIVDVPVAIPMSRPSAEIRRKHPTPAREEQEEMDIGAAGHSAPTKTSIDLLGSPTSELPNPNRFELTRSGHGPDERASADLDRIGESDGDIGGGPASPERSRVEFDEASTARHKLSSSFHLPERPKHKSRFSFEFARSTPPRHLKRQRSMSTRSGHRPNVLYDGDDLEGDLGYAAANDMEGNQRKVIVERLEAVKSKNPVFTWC